MSQTRRKCPECGSENISIRNDKVVCTNCGYIISGDQFTDEEERYQSLEDMYKKSRHSYDTKTFPEHSTAKRNLAIARENVREIIDDLHLPSDILGTFTKYYIKYAKKKKVRKDTITKISISIVYIVLRKRNINISLEKLMETSNLNESIMSSYINVREHLKVGVDPVSMKKLILSVGKDMDLDWRIIKNAFMICDKMSETYMVGKDPFGIAAAALLVSAATINKELDRGHVSEKSLVSPPTLQKRIDEIREMIRENRGLSQKLKKG